MTHLLSPAARKRGFAEVKVLEDWPRIVGAGMAKRCQPLRIEFARGAIAGGTLVLQAAGGAALELQHMGPQLIERINDYFGFRTVRQLRIVQMPLRATPVPAPPARRRLTADEELTLAAGVAAVGDDELGRALAALGRSIMARRPAS
ncbi:MAG: DciA family protein [Geminicoccaceae bacterium]|nr:DUF721 domain-containing protein [Geminicoccaceae bacterium]